MLLAAAVACAATVPAPLVGAGQHHERPLPADFEEPIALYTGVLGTFSRSVSAANAEARAYFSQGFALMYAFAKIEAGRSFREAQRRDPQCAMCYWGEAWAWGPYVNGRMTAPEAARAHAAIQKARTLAAAHASPIEQALIGAMAERYGDAFDPAAQAARDRAYAEAMARVVARWPGDLDAAALYAEALFLLLPRPGMLDLANPTVARLLRVLEAALARDVRHPGACHLYIHTTELTVEPARALACAEHLGNAMPGASHLNHMPAHIWTRVGRWGDAVRASLQAWQSDQKASRGEGLLTYPAHDLQMLAYAASMDGQASPAIQAGRGLTRLASDSTLHALTLIRFGRFDDVMTTLGDRPVGDLQAGAWDFAQGYAHLRRGRVDDARRLLDRLAASAASSKAVFKIHPVKTLLGILAGILDGEIRLASGGAGAAADGAVGGAIAAFERAVAFDDALSIDDPPPLPFTARHWLGAGLLDAKRFADAERVYREDLARRPRNGWSLLGLRQALAAQGKPTTAVDADLRANWTRADTAIRASRF